MQTKSQVGKQSQWVACRFTVALAIVCLALALAANKHAVQANSLAASMAYSGSGPAAVTASAAAMAQSDRSNAMSQTATFLGPSARLAATSVAQRLDLARAKKTRQRQFNSLRQTLVQMESVPARSLAECDEWARLDAEYDRLTGEHPENRPNELAKATECNQLAGQLGRLRNMLRAETVGGRSQVGFVGRLLAEYLRAARRTGDERLAHAFVAMLRDEPEVGETANALDALLMLARDHSEHEQRHPQQRPQVVTSSSLVEQPDYDNLGHMDRLMRHLIDQEHHLGADQFRELNQLVEHMENALDRGEVDVNSGRFRYLSGTLDAARTVLLHKLNENDGPQQHGADDYDDHDESESLFEPHEARYYEEPEPYYFEFQAPAESAAPRSAFEFAEDSHGLSHTMRDVDAERSAQEYRDSFERSSRAGLQAAHVNAAPTDRLPHEAARHSAPVVHAQQPVFTAASASVTQAPRVSEQQQHRQGTSTGQSGNVISEAQAVLRNHQPNRVRDLLKKLKNRSATP